jgi:hypothetical protein
MAHRKTNTSEIGAPDVSEMSTSDLIGKPLSVTDGVTIPYDELHWKLLHVTRADLIFAPASSCAFDKAQRDLLLKRLTPKLNAHQELHIAANDKTSQHDNRETALLRLQEILREALQPEPKHGSASSRKPPQGKRLYDKHKEAVKNADRRTQSAPIEALDLAPRKR